MKHLSTTQLEQWMSYYYENPQPDLTPMAIMTLSEGGYLSDESAMEQIMFFFSFIFRAHPEQIEVWLSSFQDLPNQEKMVILHSIWYSNTRQAKDYLGALSKTVEGEMKELVTYFQGESPPGIEQIQITSPSSLDMLWAAFMATGDEKYVIHLMSVLPYENIKDDQTKQLIGEAAKWSLISNAKKHEKVMSICVNQLTQQTENIASILKGIITEAKNSYG